MPSPPRPLSPPAGHTFSVRLSADELTRLRALALARGTDPSALVRQWIAEGGTMSPAQVAAATSGARPRWMQLAPAERRFMESLLALTARSPTGLVVLESVIDHLTALDWSRARCLDVLQVLIEYGWIASSPAEGLLTEDAIGKSAYLFLCGCASTYALELLEPGSL